ncbi:dynein axonemal heavy chain 8-like [Frankliniella occidentalis]|uniref:Dynein axonemal heavy chain 8-like n=1 Tax=Frankliniella occidentalis TaxID=133901 RepID=A0A9C6X4H0_FRAOC|nr:dynein axonemal heavy chain 8-like [Frankliniella occidentalis]
MFWMTGFFNPTGFLTAMRQDITRSHKGWALDQVVITNTVSKSGKEEWKPTGKEEGVAVYGLFLEGAQWDRRSGILKESHAKVIYSAMPVVVISAGVLSAPRDPKLYMCPVYKKPRRTDLTFITNLWLTSPKSPDHWVLRGVAMLCDTK